MPVYCYISDFGIVQVDWEESRRIRRSSAVVHAVHHPHPGRSVNGSDDECGHVQPAHAHSSSTREYAHLLPLHCVTNYACFTYVYPFMNE